MLYRRIFGIRADVLVIIVLERRGLGNRIVFASPPDESENPCLLFVDTVFAGTGYGRPCYADVVIDTVQGLSFNRRGRRCGRFFSGFSINGRDEIAVIRHARIFRFVIISPFVQNL